MRLNLCKNNANATENHIMRKWINIIKGQSLMEYNVPLDTTIEAERLATGDAVYEMAYLAPKRTGITGGKVFISTKMASHGARVKFFIGKVSEHKSFSVSIGPNPILLSNSLPEHEVKQFLPLVKQWVITNHTELLKFWNEGEDLDSDEVYNFINSLKKYIKPTESKHLSEQ